MFCSGGRKSHFLLCANEKTSNFKQIEQFSLKTLNNFTIILGLQNNYDNYACEQRI